MQTINYAHEYYLKEAVDSCMTWLKNENYPEIANVLKEIEKKRPKIFVVPNWPKEIIEHDSKDIDLMYLVNGLIEKLNCKIVQSKVNE